MLCQRHLNHYLCHLRKRPNRHHSHRMPPHQRVLENEAVAELPPHASWQPCLDLAASAPALMVTMMVMTVAILVLIVAVVVVVEEMMTNAPRAIQREAIHQPLL